LGDFVRLGGFNGGLLGGLEDAFEHALELAALCFQVAGHGVERDLRLVGGLGGGLGARQQGFEGGDPFGGGVLFGLDCSDNADGFGVQRTLAVGELLIEALHLGVGAAEAAALGLHLTGELLQLGAQLHHRRRDSGLGLGAGLAAGGIEAGIGGGAFGLGFDQVLGEMGDLLGADGGVHALAHGVLPAIDGDAFLSQADLEAQAGGLFFQQRGGGVHQAVLRGVLVLDVNVHRVIDRGGGEHRVG
jgi:hypothetical protein